MRADRELCARLIAIYTASWHSEPSAHPELCLVSGGFPSDEDQNLCIEFHEASWRSRADLVGRFADPRLKTFGRRLVYSEHRSLLSEAGRIAADLDLAERLLVNEAGPLTLGEALEQTEALLMDEIGDPTGNLAGYRAYLLARITAAEAFRRDHASRAAEAVEAVNSRATPVERTF